jgi:hypothetical protein
MIVLSLLGVSGFIFASSPKLSEGKQDKYINAEHVLKNRGYTPAEILTWKKLIKIAQKEEQGMPLTHSEQELARLDDQ